MSLNVLNSSEIATVAGGCCDRRIGIALSATVGAMAGMAVGAGLALFSLMLGEAFSFTREFYGNSDDAFARKIQTPMNYMVFNPSLLVLGGGVVGGVTMGLAASICLRCLR